MEHLPEALVAAAHDAYSARALVYAMLIDRHPEIRQRQLDQLSKHVDAGVLTETKKLILPVARLDPRARLPLLKMSMPALDMLNQRQYEPFKANIGVLIAADEKLGLFEWSLQRILIRQLDAQHSGVSHTPMRQKTLRAAGRIAPWCCRCWPGSVIRPRRMRHARSTWAGAFSGFGRQGSNRPKRADTTDLMPRWTRWMRWVLWPNGSSYRPRRPVSGPTAT